MAYTYVNFKGQGGFARVDVVRDELGQLFAQKTYFPLPQIVAQVGDEHLKRRFVREVKYQAGIQHPNVVPILKDFLEDNPPRFIMPLAEGTLKEELEIDPTLGENLHKALFDILSGLEFIHSSGYIHRDLKPANILRFSFEGQIRYAISDFGLVSATNSESSTLTGSNANGGTENYAAPELIGGFKRATARADIYAFGAILHDIFGTKAQRIPYTELTVNGPLGAIVSKCTKSLPIRRYKNVSELRDELYQVLNSEEVIFTSGGEEAVVNMLRDRNTLTDDEWDAVFMQLDRNLDAEVGIGNIIAAISLHHIDTLAETAPDLFTALGSYFLESVVGHSFGFDYCDVLASKGARFFKDADLGLQSKLALALLSLGISHNRWYVERIAVGMMHLTISPKLAERIKVEIEVQEIDFSSKINRLCQSLGINSDFLHPILREIIK